jgi:exosortase
MTPIKMRLRDHLQQPLPLMLAFAALFVVLFNPTLIGLHQRWSRFDESYSHGYLLLLIAFYLFFELRPTATTTVLSRLYLPALVVLSCVWLFFYYAGIAALQQIMLPLLVLGVCGALGGTATLRRALVPCMLIYLAIPIWDELLSRPLQILSTAVAGWTVAHVFDIPTAIKQFYISIPAGTFEIQSGCSGLVFFLSALTLGVVYGQLLLRSLRARLWCLLLAAVLGLVVNWLRIIALIVIGQRTAMHHPLINQGHLLFGWYLFSGTTLLAFILAFVFRKKNGNAPLSGASITTPQTVAIYCAPSLSRIALTALALSAGPLLLLMLHVMDGLRPPLSAPLQIGDHLIAQPDVSVSFLDAPVIASYRYTPAPTIQVTLVYYPQAFAAGKLANRQNKTLPDGWRIRKQELMQSPNLPTLAALASNESNQLQRVWSWYRFGNKNIAKVDDAKAAQLQQAFQLRFDGSYISITTPCAYANCKGADNLLAEHAPAILAALYAWTEQQR